MTTLRESLEALLSATTKNRSPYVRQDGVHFTLFPNDDQPVINFDRREGGDLNRLDVDWTRAVLRDLGWDVVGEWQPRQGVSWLSDGVSAGVSFRVQKR